MSDLIHLQNLTKQWIENNRIKRQKEYQELQKQIEIEQEEDFKKWEIARKKLMNSWKELAIVTASSGYSFVTIPMDLKYDLNNQYKSRKIENIEHEIINYFKNKGFKIEIYNQHCDRSTVEVSISWTDDEILK